MHGEPVRQEELHETPGVDRAARPRDADDHGAPRVLPVSVHGAFLPASRSARSIRIHSSIQRSKFSASSS